MKFPRLLAALFVAAMLIAPKADATVISVFEPGTISSGKHGSIVLESGQGLYRDTVSFAGKLAANTKIVFTLTATKASTFLTGNGYAETSYPTLAYGIAQGLHSWGLTERVLTGSASVPSSSKPVTTLTIVNATSSTQYITAYFDYLISLAKGGKIYLTAQTFATPLPASVVLFLSALMGLFGFTSYRKARGEA